MPPSVDSLLQVDAFGEPQSALERGRFAGFKHPQVARRQWLLQALESHGHNVTDEFIRLARCRVPGERDSG